MTCFCWDWFDCIGRVFYVIQLCALFWVWFTTARWHLCMCSSQSVLFREGQFMWSVTFQDMLLPRDSTRHRNVHVTLSNIIVIVHCALWSWQFNVPFAINIHNHSSFKIITFSHRSNVCRLSFAAALCCVLACIFIAVASTFIPASSKYYLLTWT